MKPINQLRYTILLSTVIVFSTLVELILNSIELGVLQTSWKWQAGLGGLLVLLISHITLLWRLERGWGERTLKLVAAITRWLDGLGYLNLMIFGLTITVFPYLVGVVLSEQLSYFYLRVLLLWSLAIFGAALLFSSKLKTGWGLSLGFSGLFLALGIRIAGFIPAVSSFPFSMGWSEASRYYYASLLLSKSIYGQTLALSPWHPSRYMLQSLPFLIPSLPLWFHRLWQVILWIGLTFLGGLLFSKRMKLQRRSTFWLLTIWTFLYLLIGPVYYHLMISVILVLWGVDTRRPWRSLLFVVLASIWAGISRFNWIPVPGFLAATMYFLETPKSKHQGISAYAFPAALWVGVGSLTALLAQFGYAFLSGNELGAFGSSLTSALLWERLLPNPTFKLGILTGILLITSPLLVHLIGMIQRWIKSFHPLRTISLLTPLVVLFGGGLVVSVKIGGGGNLHNMDAFVVLLVLINGYAYFEVGQIGDQNWISGKSLKWMFVAVTIAIPILWNVYAFTAFEPLNVDKAQVSLDALRSKVDEEMRKGGEILFMSERHLMAIGEFEDIPLVSEYEKIFLMEMAMSGNRVYLNDFYEEVRAHRFQLIVSSALPVIRRGPEHEFGIEDDVWVENITIPLLESYSPTLKIDEGGVWVLEPILGGSD